MRLHHESTDGRVLRGADAMKHLELHKRDSHGDKIVLNYIPPDDTKVRADSKEVTVESIIFVTLSPSFTGSIAGYTTLTDTQSHTTTSSPTPDSSSQTTPAVIISTPSPASPSMTNFASSTPNAASPASTSPGATDSASMTMGSASPFVIPPPPAVAATSTANSASALVGGGVQQSGTATILGGSPMVATHGPGAQVSHNGAGLSVGVKAGISVGASLAFALLGGLLYFFWRRRKNSRQAFELNEPRTSSVFGGRSIVAALTGRASAVSERHPPSVRSTRTATTAPRLSLRPITQFLPNLGENRKSNSNPLALAGAPMSERVSDRRANGNPFTNNAAISTRPPQNPFEEAERNSAFNPKSTKAATANPTAAAALKSSGPNNVHRVQLDFKPSMDDELELISGELVRMLHEYDDGWALCIRMDRSQQGVAPRTCLSKMPVQPRQIPTPRGPDGRSTDPTMGSAQGRRPPTEGQTTPPPSALKASNSALGTQQSRSPTGGVPTRKPVPDQST